MSMEQYQVKMTDHATEQVGEAVSYISKMLLVPDVALRWSERIQAEIASLSKMPGRHPLTPEEPWRSEGVHKMSVENFLVYYLDQRNGADRLGYCHCVWTAGSAEYAPQYAH